MNEFNEDMSRLEWMYHMLGAFYAVVIPAVGLLLFIGACIVVAKSKRPSSIAAYLVFLPLPLMIGFYGTIEGFIHIGQVISLSGSTPKHTELWSGFLTSWFTSMAGLGVMFPSFLVLAFGLF